MIIYGVRNSFFVKILLLKILILTLSSSSIKTILFGHYTKSHCMTDVRGTSETTSCRQEVVVTVQSNFNPPCVLRSGGEGKVWYWVVTPCRYPSLKSPIFTSSIDRDKNDRKKYISEYQVSKIINLTSYGNFRVQLLTTN